MAERALRPVPGDITFNRARDHVRNLAKEMGRSFDAAVVNTIFRMFGKTGLRQAVSENISPCSGSDYLRPLTLKQTGS